MSSIAAVEVSAGALQHNARALRRLAPKGAEVAAVVKGNAYGHGLELVVPVLEPLVDAFQVDDLDELAILRRFTGKRALVFGYVPQDSIEEALRLGCEPCVYDFERLSTIEAAGRNLGIRPRVHLKIDALLGRQGVLPNSLGPLLAELRKRDIEVVAAYAHYANIEDTTDPSHAIQQECAFERAFLKVRDAFPQASHHLSATSGLLAREGASRGSRLVRLGIGLYGLYPSEPFAQSHAVLGLRPAMAWKTMLAQVKRVPKGFPIGYGLTYRASREMTIGIVPQGYADGFDRGLSGCGEVLVKGSRCPVLGRIAMNMCAVDLTLAPNSKPEDEVVLLGAQGGERISAEEVAAKLGTIHYEVVSRVSPLLVRKLIE